MSASIQNQTTVQTDPTELLQKHFGWTEFKPGQLDVVTRLLAGKSVLSVFPTGGGKSLCYQLPALAFDGLTIVVSPLIALMKDQIDQLQSLGISAVRLDSSLTGDQYREAMNLIRSGTAKLMYVAPERFFNERFRSSLDGIKISMFAIDEAHCISQWGHNFRPDYLKLADLTRRLKVERVLALTATATPTVQDDICRTFDIQSDDAICTPFFRPNLHIRSRIVNREEHVDVLVDRLKSEPSGATIVYVTLQKTAEQIATEIDRSGLAAKAYHAGMNPEQRNEIQEWFMQGENKIVVATIAFGMGIDKSDIRYVYHFNPPKSIESYAQEIGRAGRDGKQSACEMILVPDDRITLENFVYGDTPSAPSVQKFIENIAAKPDDFFISQYKLGAECDIKSLVIKTLLTYLELDGFLESTSPRYDSYSFKPLVSSAEILNKFEGERKDFAQRLLASSSKRKTWFSIDLPASMKKLGCDRARIVKALDYFAEKGWIELKVSGLVHGYRKLNPIESTHELAAEFSQRIESREQSEIERMDKVFVLAQAKSCQPGILSDHFGQPLESDCGVCSACLNDGPFVLPSVEQTTLPDPTIGIVTQLITEHPTSLNSARSVARFLCGITSPALTKSKLSRHQSFGICDSIPFAAIKQQIESLIEFD